MLELRSFRKYLNTIAVVLLSFAFFASPIQAQRASEPESFQTTVQDIVELVEFSGIGICESRSLIAIRIDRPHIQTNWVQHRLLIVDWRSGLTIREAHAGESVVNSAGSYEVFELQWSPDCNWLYYRALHEGEIQVWALNARTGEQHQVTVDAGHVLAFSVSPDGRSITYEADSPRNAILEAEAQQNALGALIDQSMYNWTPLFNSLPMHGEWRTMRLQGLYPEHLLSEQLKRVRVVALDNRSVRASTEAESTLFDAWRNGVKRWFAEEVSNTQPWSPSGLLRPVLSSSGGAAAVALSNKSGGSARERFVLGLITQADPSITKKCGDERCIANKIIPLAWSDDDKIIYFIAEHGIARGANIYGWTPHNSEVRSVFRSDGTLGALVSGYKHSSLQCPVLQETAFCTSSEHGAPPQLIAINLVSGEATPVYDPNNDLRARFSLRTKLLHWDDKFGRRHDGILVFPRDFEEGVSYPLILTTYTCPGFLTGGTADGGPEYALAEHGFLILCISANSDDPPYDVTSQESIGPTRYVAALAEYSSAINFLVQKGLVDSKLVGATGMSFGTQAVSFALTNSDIFRAVAITNIGVFEPWWEMFLIPGSEYRDALLADVKIGEEGYTASEVYADISVSERAELVTAAVLVQTSDREYLGSLGVVTKLMAANKPVEMHVFRDETHQFHQPIHRYVNFTRNVDWFRFWLQNYEDPDPKKAAQYMRWQKLRRSLEIGDIQDAATFD